MNKHEGFTRNIPVAGCTKTKIKCLVFLSGTSLIHQSQPVWTNHKCFPLPSDMTCSGTARVNHSDQPPSYTDTSGWPHSWAASTTWHAVTAEPHRTHRGRLRSTPAWVNRAWSCFSGRKWPDLERKEENGMLMEPGMWPGSVSVGTKERIWLL